MKVAVIGGGWAGFAAAVGLVRAGHQPSLHEATRLPGGRARALPLRSGVPGWPEELTLDNGQHILIGAYSETLALMREVGVDPEASLLRLPLAMCFPDGTGLALPDWPAPLDAAWGILSARGWSWTDRWSLLRASLSWRRMGFSCPPDWSVARLCQGMAPAVYAGLIAPLTVSALNTPPQTASASVLLRVLHDALFASSGGSNLLLPRVDLASLFPLAASKWIEAHGGRVRLGQRVEQLVRVAEGWSVAGEPHDRIVLACPPWEASRLLRSCGVDAAEWLRAADGLQFEAITTVYAHAGQARLPRPMMALRDTDRWPAQFVLDRGQLDGPAGLLAFVVSASRGERAELQDRVIEQGRAQLGLPGLQAVQTVVEKRATFACTPGLQRPGSQIAPGIVACGDYVDGPYPATLEGAVRSGLQAAALLGR